MVATDIYRPAAIDQLVTLGKQVDVPVFEMGTTVKPPEIAKKGLAEAKRIKADVVLVDTAGRLQARDLSNDSAYSGAVEGQTLRVLDHPSGLL